MEQILPPVVVGSFIPVFTGFFLCISGGFLVRMSERISSFEYVIMVGRDPVTLPTRTTIGPPTLSAWGVMLVSCWWPACVANIWGSSWVIGSMASQPTPPSPEIKPCYGRKTIWFPLNMALPKPLFLRVGRLLGLNSSRMGVLYTNTLHALSRLLTCT